MHGEKVYAACYILLSEIRVKYMEQIHLKAYSYFRLWQENANLLEKAIRLLTLDLSLAQGHLKNSLQFNLKLKQIASYSASEWLDAS